MEHTVVTLVVAIFIASCIVLVISFTLAVAFFVFTKRRESNEKVEALRSQRDLDDKVMKDMLGDYKKICDVPPPAPVETDGI